MKPVRSRNELRTLRLLRRRVVGLIGFAFVFGVLSSACDRRDVNSRDSNQPSPVRSETAQGPVTLTVEVSPSRVRLSDEPQMTLTVAHRPGVEIEMPDFGGVLGDFLVQGFREGLPESDGQRVIRRRFYTLEPTRSGTLEVEPIVVAYIETDVDMAPERQIVESRSLSVEVTALVDTDSPSLDSLEGLASPDAPENPPSLSWLLLIGTLASIGMLVVGLCVLVAWRLVRKRESDGPPPTPREIALLELDRLWRDELHSRDVKQYYSQLTDIVRRYIERISGVRAPEQTTEEFLRAAGDIRHFSAAQRGALRDFLESADLVKFAGHEPGDSDIRAAYDGARDFVARESASGRDAVDSSAGQVPPGDGQPPE